MVAGSIFVEVTFALLGLGALTIDAVSKRGMPLILGTTLVFSLFVVMADLTVHILHTWPM